MRPNNGFTLMELIIVLAIIAIVGAIILPNFITGTDKARLVSDIQSGKIIQNAIDLYETEQGSELNRGNINSELLKTLVDGGYLRGAYSTPQTKDAKWVYSEEKKMIVLDISGCTKKVNDQAQKLSNQEKESLIFGS